MLSGEGGKEGGAAPARETRTATPEQKKNLLAQGWGKGKRRR